MNEYSKFSDLISVPSVFTQKVSILLRLALLGNLVEMTLLGVGVLRNEPSRKDKGHPEIHSHVGI